MTFENLFDPSGPPIDNEKKKISLGTCLGGQIPTLLGLLLGTAIKRALVGRPSAATA